MLNAILQWSLTEYLALTRWTIEIIIGLIGLKILLDINRRLK